MLKIFVPENEGIFKIAAAEFVKMWQSVTGTVLETVSADDPSSDLIVLGSDAVNAFTHSKIIDKVISQFKIGSGSDDYQIVSASENGRKLLFIAGGRPRALLYGVYRFFELRANCRYFWDGDIIPKSESIDISDLDVSESPRFKYRGLRYFAHRSLNRFQAEHWSFDEWKAEIDWVMKKRMNLFMLRIGLDDLFQKAFPETVSYPDGYKIPEAVERSYDDRTLFWSMECRANLRRQVLAYARERDLLHPEDIGTMTHWYSRTPLEYLDKVDPDFMPQATEGYNEKTGLVWDIRQEKNLDAYWKLTETHIREYGSPEIFHTIGLAERRCYEDRASNHQMKLYTYRRIQKKLREKYPNAPLLIASWDFSMYWSAEEVRELVRELDPSNTLILDYTSDTDDESRTFINWDLIGKFPWIFGIFHAFEPNNEPRGNYSAMARRLPMAAADPMCKGMVYWPENSHTDTLLLEYLAANAWDPSNDNVVIKSFVRKFCAERYNDDARAEMLELWEAALPFIEARHWNGPGARDVCVSNFLFSEMFFAPCASLLSVSSDFAVKAGYYRRKLAAVAKAAPEFIRKAAKIDLRDENGFIFRDLLDLIRCAVARGLAYGFAECSEMIGNWRNGKDNSAEICGKLSLLREAEVKFYEILSADSDYSLYASLKDLEAKNECNPEFEYTLKGNAENNYCRTTVIELFKGVFIPELDLCIEFLKDAFSKNQRDAGVKSADVAEFTKAVKDQFYAVPLKELAPDSAAALQQLPENLESMAEILEKISADVK